MNNTCLRTFGLVALAAALLPAVSAGEVLDSGIYHVFQNDRALGAETFAFEQLHDSLYVYCEVIETIPTPAGDKELRKTVRYLRNTDHGLIKYESEQHFDGVKLNRGVAPQDTSLTLWRQENDVGEGSVIVRPPGSVYILDPQVFVLFDVLSRDLNERPFKSRPVTLLVLSERDTVVEATAKDLGTETLRWGMKPVQARKFRIADTTSEFFTWVAPHGVMIQMEQPATGLRVVRKTQLDGPETLNRPSESP